MARLFKNRKANKTETFARHKDFSQQSQSRCLHRAGVMRSWRLCLVRRDKWRERGASGEVTAPNWLQSGLRGEGPKGALDQKPGMGR